jgi:hypothetical protein
VAPYGSLVSEPPGAELVGLCAKAASAVTSRRVKLRDKSRCMEVSPLSGWGNRREPASQASRFAIERRVTALPSASRPMTASRGRSLAVRGSLPLSDSVVEDEVAVSPVLPVPVLLRSVELLPPPVGVVPEVLLEPPVELPEVELPVEGDVP